MKNILFYKYVKIEDPESFRDEHIKLCKSLNLLGKVLVSKEGINGCVSGKVGDLEKYKSELTKDSRFMDVVFKEGETDKHTFKKMFVRIRDEIVTSGLNVDINHKAPYVEPKELKDWLDSDQDVLMIDARNDYEFKIGKFEGAKTLPMKTFREWKDEVKKLSNLKNKKIVTYCTGGVRCEKASAYLVEQGFTDVHQLHGGILQYGKECGNSHWEGKCFVFDERGAVDIDPNNESDPISLCKWCRTPCASYHNCLYTVCDKRFISCSECLEKHEGCCSKACRNVIKEKVLLKRV